VIGDPSSIALSSSFTASGGGHGDETQGHAEFGTPATADPVEIAMGAEGVAAGGAAHSLLVRHTALIEADLHHRRLQIAGERMTNLLKFGAGLLALIAVTLLGVMAFQASRADGLIVRPFSVPPELAQRGITGEAVASQLLDHLSRMSSQARSAERLRNAEADWGETVSIEIPQTGISLAQLDQWLRQKLGHEVRVSGEVMRDADGALRLTSRSGSAPLTVQNGSDADLAAMIERAAEGLLEHEQPVVYGSYLMLANRWEDTKAFALRRIELRDPASQARGYVVLGNALTRLEGDMTSMAAFRRAYETDPVAGASGFNNLISRAQIVLGQPEYALWLARQTAKYSDYSNLIPAAGLMRQRSSEARIASIAGDNATAARILAELAPLEQLGTVGSDTAMWAELSQQLALLHEPKRALESLSRFRSGTEFGRREAMLLLIGMAREDWAEAVRAADGIDADNAKQPDGGIHKQLVKANRALALARLGRLAEAQVIIEDTQLSCQVCIISRAEIAEAGGQRAAADHWFAQASRLAPSIPTADVAWGRAVMARGDIAAAVPILTRAQARSPRNADARHYLGEALLLRGDAKGAAAQFSTAADLAPNWARNHILWAEALGKLGKSEDAAAHRATARKLDLTPSDRARLG